MLSMACRAMYQLSRWQMGKRRVLFNQAHLVARILSCLVGYCTWLIGRCVADMKLSIRVWYCHIPSHGFPRGAR